jgi:SNF2 family DNA or RNA helicase
MIIHTPSRSLLLKVRPAALATLRNIFPAHSRPVDYQGHNLALPHSLPVVKVLRNMQIKAPSPIRYYYDWPRPARFKQVFDHQVTTAEFLTLHPRCFCLNEMGTAKSASTLWAIDYLMTLGLVHRVVIVAPLSTLQQVWLNEIFDVCMHRTALVLHAAADKRRALLAREVDIYIVNPAGLRILQKDISARKDIDLIVVDEAATYRNATTEQYKTLEKTIKGKKLWLLTGAPCPNAPTDAWALARLVDPSRVPPYFTQFKRATMNQLSQYKWVPRPGSHEIAYQAMQPAIRFKKSECLSLPPVTYSNRACELSDEQKHAYSQMKQHLVADARGGHIITAANAADKIGKLRQILCGAVKNPATGDYVTLDHKPRLAVLMEAIEQASAKVLVIVPFKGIVRVLHAELQAWHNYQGDGRRVELVNGDVSVRDRNRIFQDFRDDPSLTELVCHPKVMAHGLNMTEADLVIFYAPIYSNDQAMQVMDRINRPGQTRHMTILRIVANALERDIYAVVEGRALTQESILSLYKKELQLDVQVDTAPAYRELGKAA